MKNTIQSKTKDLREEPMSEAIELASLVAELIRKPFKKIKKLQSQKEML